ncbi:MAG: shikimate dehydrogenase, partial [Peptococcaceae bacterium]|nr:shikimate dehydrogenase [Peptococcaceae bacterium]
IVNTTSLGMSPNVDDMPPVHIGALNKAHLVVDLIYNPMETKLLRLAKAQGAQIASGLGMFVYQGVLAFEKWTGKTPGNVDAIETQLIERLTR